MWQYLGVPAALLALLSIGIILFKIFKGTVKGVIAVDKLIQSIEDNTAAHTKIARTVERFRKTTKAELAGIKRQVEDMDSRLDDYDQILSPQSIKKAG